MLGSGTSDLRLLRFRPATLRPGMRNGIRPIGFSLSVRPIASNFTETHLIELIVRTNMKDKIAYK